jgi:threonyl-tRNA synthetase
MHRRVYEVLGLTNFRIRLSCREVGTDAKQKFVENAAAWDWAEATLREVLLRSGMPFEEGVGEAAFYGPKIDFQFRSVTGREETASTLQLDFAMPERLDLRYVGADGAEHRPFVLHRAPLGTHERFVALLLEQYGGAFPTWLAPVQARVVPVSERFCEYGNRIVKMLRQKRIRAELDTSSDGMGKKIRNATLRKIPNIVVVGDREAAQGTVTWRKHGSVAQETMPLDLFVSELVRAIEERRPWATSPIA